MILTVFIVSVAWYLIIMRGVDRVILAIRAATLRKHVYHRLPRALAPDSD